MTPNLSTIDQLFNGARVFKIPFYQRSYVWGEKEWERFLKDMVGVGQQQENYFLGVIILKQLVASTSQQGDYKLVIDGQQRLTTIAIFMKILYGKLNQLKWFDRKFVMPDDDETLSIQHSHIDKVDFERVMRLETLEELEGDSNIIRAYNYFLKEVDVTKLNTERLRYNVQLIDIIIDHNDNEQQIFDTINSLGVDLTTAELLKNHLFDEHSVNKYNQFWKPVFEGDDDTVEFWAADLLKGRVKQRNVEAFLSAYLQIKVHEPGRNISAQDKLEYSRSNALFYNYKKFISSYFTGNEAEFIQDLTAYAKIFRYAFMPNIASTILPMEAGIERVNFLIYVLGNTTLMPYVMYIEKNTDSEEEKAKIYEYLEAYVIRRLICARSPKNYSDLFSENLIGNNAITHEKLVEYINQKDSSNALAMPNNSELLECALSEKHPNYRGLAILYLMESRMRNDQMLTTQLFNYKAYTLEHLMPQRWQYNWPLPQGMDSSERARKVCTLGNMTLITQSLNSSIGNADWATKLNGKTKHQGLKAYARDLLTLSDTLSLSVWDEQTIDARSTWLAYHASKLWPSALLEDEALNEPELSEGVLIAEVVDEDDITRAQVRDRTRYSLDGSIFLPKGYFVHDFIALYINKHPDITFEKLKAIFNDSLLEPRHRVRGLLFKKDDYDAWERPDKPRRYGATRENAILQTADGVQFYVNTQWTKNSVENIIKIAREDGFRILVELNN